MIFLFINKDKLPNNAEGSWHATELENHLKSKSVYNRRGQKVNKNKFVSHAKILKIGKIGRMPIVFQ